VGIEAEVIADMSPVTLPIWIREFTSRASGELGAPYQVMTSGAGHDAQVINSRVPAGMIFVPSRDGLSHVPAEWTSASDIALGVEVLAASLLKLDAFLSGLAGASHQ
jgi:allantoate deiminase